MRCALLEGSDPPVRIQLICSLSSADSPIFAELVPYRVVVVCEYQVLSYPGLFSHTHTVNPRLAEKQSRITRRCTHDPEVCWGMGHKVLLSDVQRYRKHCCHAPAYLDSTTSFLPPMRSPHAIPEAIQTG